MSSDYNTRHTLIAKIRNQHDDHSWEDFVYFYQRYIYVVIAKMGVNNQDVEDLVQRVLLALWEKLPSFEYEPNKCKFRTWMNQITRNTVIAYFRKQKRYKNDLDRAASIRLNEEDPEQSEPEVYNMAEKEWKLHVSNLAWENIKDDFKGKAAQVFLAFSEGKEIEQICLDLDIKKNTAYVLKNRVQDKLYKEIRRLDDELS
ncbi:probable RNA polymerase sigma-H factor [Lentisphaera araneosa HTCC2155]|uniref:Probable RNA polymerase sigma-H factor n=1 Tax=Lentisphaera araneosa HTCC2155 TaxID=313628 RepID=A6DIS0_9BACT|nr:sigma-70 family RNA polymerase sigma factor [Lentisphaera araneosa]EDM28356.1 probable RNA polymerase sigma-H factor [Lentisphaera araneosa HTCC2155]